MTAPLTAPGVALLVLLAGGGDLGGHPDGRELFYAYQVDNQAIVVPETIDAIRALCAPSVTQNSPSAGRMPHWVSGGRSCNPQPSGGPNACE
ncbi:MAG TPA: hypothetical protein VMQ83_02965 [Gammaproteobacteria bacterium]|nr:hypothetical protein [Gammaproteobacteria bacterium]